MNNMQTISCLFVNWRRQVTPILVSESQSEKSPDSINKAVFMGTLWLKDSSNTATSKTAVWSERVNGDLLLAKRGTLMTTPWEHLNHAGGPANERRRTLENWVLNDDASKSLNLRLLLAWPTYSWIHPSRFQCPIRHDHLHVSAGYVFHWFASLICNVLLQIIMKLSGTKFILCLQVIKGFRFQGPP